MNRSNPFSHLVWIALILLLMGGLSALPAPGVNRSSAAALSHGTIPTLPPPPQSNWLPVVRGPVIKQFTWLPIVRGRPPLLHTWLPRAEYHPKVIFPRCLASASADSLVFDPSKGPTLIYTGENTSMRLVWQWTEVAAFQVEWGLEGNYNLGRADATEYDPLHHLYAYTITGLQPDTAYSYRVVSGLCYSAGSFHTAPPLEAADLKFVSYADTRDYPERHDGVAGQIIRLYQADPAYQTFTIFGGDFVNAGDDENSWENEFFAPRWKNIRGLLAHMPLLPAMGNHEGTGELFRRYFPQPFGGLRYGSFDYGPVHIVLLDQYSPFAPGSTQYQWLEQDLQNSQKTWKLVVMHEPAWSADGFHTNNLQAQTLQPLFEREGVALVLSGHNHYYARAIVGGVTHLTVGTGAGPLHTPLPGQPYVVYAYSGNGFARFEITGNTLTGSFIASDGTVKDTFVLQR